MSADQVVVADVIPGDDEEPSARSLPKSAWLGVVVIAAIAVWLGIVGFRTLLVQHEVGVVIARMAVETVGPAVLGFVAVVILCEQIWPAVPTPLLHRAHLVDALYVAIAAVLVVPVLPVVQMGLNVELRAHAPFLILGRLPAVPEVVITIAALVGIDFMNWGAHMANHRFLPLWRLHALHHSQEDLSVLTTFRTHPLLHVPVVRGCARSISRGTGHRCREQQAERSAAAAMRRRCTRRRRDPPARFGRGARQRKRNRSGDSGSAEHLDREMRPVLCLLTFKMEQSSVVGSNSHDSS